LEEEALVRTLWRARLLRTVDISQNILRSEYECYSRIPYFKTLLLCKAYWMQFYIACRSRLCLMFGKNAKLCVPGPSESVKRLVLFTPQHYSCTQVDNFQK